MTAKTLYEPEPPPLPPGCRTPEDVELLGCAGCGRRLLARIHAAWYYGIRPERRGNLPEPVWKHCGSPLPAPYCRACCHDAYSRHCEPVPLMRASQPAAVGPRLAIVLRHAAVTLGVAAAIDAFREEMLRYGD